MRSKAPINRQQQKGFTFIELIVTFAIIAGLVLVLLNRGDKAESDSKIQTEIENVATLTSTVRNYYGSAGSNGYTGLTNAVVYKAIPKNMQGSGTNIRNSWNNAGITLASTGGGSAFTITATSYPESACEQIAARTYNTFTSVTANGTAVTSPSVASTACNAASNTLVWTTQ